MKKRWKNSRGSVGVIDGMAIELTGDGHTINEMGEGDVVVLDRRKMKI